MIPLFNMTISKVILAHWRVSRYTEVQRSPRPMFSRTFSSSTNPTWRPFFDILCDRLLQFYAWKTIFPAVSNAVFHHFQLLHPPWLQSSPPLQLGASQDSRGKETAGLHLKGLHIFEGLWVTARPPFLGDLWGSFLIV